jgi:hypothetical protein
MQLSELVDGVVEKMSTNAPDVDTLAGECLIDAYTAVGTKYPFVDLQNFTDKPVELDSVTGARLNTITLSSDIHAVLGVAILDPRQCITGTTTPMVRRIHPTSWRQVESMKTIGEGAVTQYARFKNTLYLRATPDYATLSFRLWVWSYPDVANGIASTLNVPPEWVELVEWEAVWRGLLRQRNYTEATNVKQNIIYSMLMEKVPSMKQYVEKQDWDSQIVITTGYYPATKGGK